VRLGPGLRAAAGGDEQAGREDGGDGAGARGLHDSLLWAAVRAAGWIDERTDGPPAGQGAVFRRSQAAASGGNRSPSSSWLVSRTSPAGSATGSSPRFRTQPKAGPRLKASTAGALGSHSKAASAVSTVCRSRRAARYSVSIEPGSAPCAAAVSGAQSGGCGNQVAVPSDGLKPYGGRSPDHGNGTRHPSRPGSTPPERKYIGSWRRAAGTST